MKWESEKTVSTVESQIKAEMSIYVIFNHQLMAAYFINCNFNVIFIHLSMYFFINIWFRQSLSSIPTLSDSLNYPSHFTTSAARGQRRFQHRPSPHRKDHSLYTVEWETRRAPSRSVFDKVVMETRCGVVCTSVLSPAQRTHGVTTRACRF